MHTCMLIYKIRKFTGAVQTCKYRTRIAIPRNVKNKAENLEQYFEFKRGSRHICIFSLFNVKLKIEHFENYERGSGKLVTSSVKVGFCTTVNTYN